MRRRVSSPEIAARDTCEGIHAVQARSVPCARVRADVRRRTTLGRRRSPAWTRACYAPRSRKTIGGDPFGRSRSSIQVKPQTNLYTFGPRFADRKSSVDPLNARVLKPSSDRRSRSSKPGRFQSTRTRDMGCGMKKRERLPLAACRHIATRECTHRASSSLRWVPPCTPRRSSCVMRRWTSRTGTSARTS
jgi:hypothetical protein